MGRWVGGCLGVWSSSWGVLHSPSRKGGSASKIESLPCCVGLQGGREGGPGKDKDLPPPPVLITDPRAVRSGPHMHVSACHVPMPPVAPPRLSLLKKACHFPCQAAPRTCLCVPLRVMGKLGSLSTLLTPDVGTGKYLAGSHPDSPEQVAVQISPYQQHGRD